MQQPKLDIQVKYKIFSPFVIFLQMYLLPVELGLIQNRVEELTLRRPQQNRTEAAAHSTKHTKPCQQMRLYRFWNQLQKLRYWEA